MQQLEKRFQDAVASFQARDFRSAILSFVSLFQEEYRKEDILAILDAACYFPNEEEMRENYNANIAALKEYPFILGEVLLSFNDLPFRLYMIDDSEFYVYEVNSHNFTEIYRLSSEEQYDLHSNRLESALFLEDEADFFHLTFLNDVIRKSEDLAYDNHIYLFYNSPLQLAKLLLTTRIGPLLAEKKFVFLIGEENRSGYADFEERFGIDYSQGERKNLRIDDIKRMIFSWKISSASGTSFLADILDFHPDLLTIPDTMMNYFPEFYAQSLDGKTVAEAISSLRKLPESDQRKSFIMKLVRYDPQSTEGKFMPRPLLKELNRISSERFLTELEHILEGKMRPTAREWLIGIYLTYSNCHGRHFDGRVIPALYVYPHDEMRYLAGYKRESACFYFDLTTQFPYYRAVVMIRDPVTQAPSIMKAMVTNSKSTDPFYAMAFAAFLPRDFFFPTQHPLYQRTKVIRFEDLKLNTDATFASLAAFLNVPITESMYQTTWCGIKKSGIGQKNDAIGCIASDGFDPAPIYKTYSNYLSIFDKYRLELVLSKLMSAYGYQAKYYDGQVFTDSDVYKLMELPFLCESIQTEISKETKRSGRATALGFIKFMLAIKAFPFSVNGLEGTFAPLDWLRPKEELQKVPLYTTRC